MVEDLESALARAIKSFETIPLHGALFVSFHFCFTVCPPCYLLAIMTGRKLHVHSWKHEQKPSPNACSDFIWDRGSGGAGRAAKPLTSGFQIFENEILNCYQNKRETPERIQTLRWRYLNKILLIPVARTCKPRQEEGQMWGEKKVQFLRKVLQALDRAFIWRAC